MNKKTILIIDDDEGICGLLKRLFDSEGFETFIANGGVKGLELIKQEKPDVVLLDINMPEMGGISLYHSLASVYDQSRELPVFIMSGQAVFKDVFEGLKIKGFIQKPFDLDDILEKVNSVF